MWKICVVVDVNGAVQITKNEKIMNIMLENRHANNTKFVYMVFCTFV